MRAGVGRRWGSSCGLHSDHNFLTTWSTVGGNAADEVESPRGVEWDRVVACDPTSYGVCGIAILVWSLCHLLYRVITCGESEHCNTNVFWSIKFQSLQEVLLIPVTSLASSVSSLTPISFLTELSLSLSLSQLQKWSKKRKPIANLQRVSPVTKVWVEAQSLRYVLLKALKSPGAAQCWVPPTRCSTPAWAHCTITAVTARNMQIPNTALLQAPPALSLPRATAISLYWRILISFFHKPKSLAKYSLSPVSFFLSFCLCKL